MKNKKKYIMIFILILSISLLGFNLVVFSSFDKADKVKNYIFVGDSRTTGMEKAINSMGIEVYDNLHFVAANGKGLKWLQETGIDEVQEILDNSYDEIFNIVFILGVNDLSNVSKYKTQYNKLADKWKEHNLCVVSVNPIMEDVLLKRGFKKRTDAEIRKFNKTISEDLNTNITYLDTYSILCYQTGFSTIDGLHYTKPTYIDIYKMIIKLF